MSLDDHDVSPGLAAVRDHPWIDALICGADEQLAAIGYTEHGRDHAHWVAGTAAQLLVDLGFPSNLQRLAAIAGYTHDAGNALARKDHGALGAALLAPILREIGVAPDESLIVLRAVANHESGAATPEHPVTAALILADKADVQRERSRRMGAVQTDVHNRIHYAVTDPRLRVSRDGERIELEISIDLAVATAPEYFELFAGALSACSGAAGYFGRRFAVRVNGVLHDDRGGQWGAHV